MPEPDGDQNRAVHGLLKLLVVVRGGTDVSSSTFGSSLTNRKLHQMLGFLL
jgi:hypothetical protein